MDKAIKKEKVFEAVIGFIFLLPAVIGVICFVVNLCTGGDSCKLRSLSGIWESYGEAAENTPVYFGLMAIAGAYMLKNSLRYLFLKEEKPEESNKTNN